MRFCLVYPYTYWLMGTPSGGAEKQVGLLAQHLARRGNEVTFVALEWRAQDEEIGGVLVRPGWDADRGTRWLRAATHRLPNLKRVLREVNADLYYVRGALAVSRWVIASAHSVGAPALLGLASDRNLLPESGRTVAPLGHRPVGMLTGPLAWHLLQRPALRAADAVIVQNSEQASLCSHMGLPHVLIPSIVQTPPSDLIETEREYDVVWAANVNSRARRGKGVRALCFLAEALPGVRFAVAGVLTYASQSGGLAELKALSNVDVFGLLDYQEAQQLIARSRLVLNTSFSEGFSNVMLEGWALGTPAVTLTVNPSGLLADGRWPRADGQPHHYRGALGACARGDIHLLAQLIDEAIGDEAALSDVGRRCRAYVGEVHGGDVVCAKYEDLAALPRYTPRGDVPTHDTMKGWPTAPHTAD